MRVKMKLNLQPLVILKRKNYRKKGPMDMFRRNHVLNLKKRKKERQANIEEACDKNLKALVHQYITRLLYQASLSFILVELKSFQDMIYGPHLPVLVYNEIRVPLLNKEMDYIEGLLKDHKVQWAKHCCSIISYTWIDRKQRCLINFLVNSHA